MENTVVLTEAPLSVEAAVNQVAGPAFGAVTTFIGMPRDNGEGHTVHRLEYQAYEAMARHKLLQILQDAQEQFALGRSYVAHRLGPVPTVEASIVIACAAPHRAGALQAVSYVIERVKHEVPVWKKEVRTDGEFWKANC